MKAISFSVLCGIRYKRADITLRDQNRCILTFTHIDMQA